LVTLLPAGKSAFLPRGKSRVNQGLGASAWECLGGPGRFFPETEHLRRTFGADDGDSPRTPAARMMMPAHSLLYTKLRSKSCSRCGSLCRAPRHEATQKLSHTRSKPDDSSLYSGCEPLDVALADRFAFIVQIPEWSSLSSADQETIILTSDDVPGEGAKSMLRSGLEIGRSLSQGLHAQHATLLATYVRVMCSLLAQAELSLSPRRAMMMLRNITTGVHRLTPAFRPSARVPAQPQRQPDARLRRG
jgi:hypothetical protein